MGRGAFEQTHWSRVLATRDEDAPEARDALERLCRTYWFPLYAYVRRRGYSREEAEDLTQAFFAHLLEGNRITRADPQRGRFRSFLLASVQNFLAGHRDRLKAQKRGGRAPMVAWDSVSAESRYRSEASGPQAPEEICQRPERQRRGPYQPGPAVQVMARPFADTGRSPRPTGPSS